MQEDFNSITGTYTSAPDGPAGNIDDDTATGWGGMADFSDRIAEAYERISDLMQGSWDAPDNQEPLEQRIAATSVPSAPPAFVFSVALENDIQVMPRLKLLRRPRR